jgi:hypothetical protein
MMEIYFHYCHTTTAAAIVHLTARQLNARQLKESNRV